MHACSPHDRATGAHPNRASRKSTSPRTDQGLTVDGGFGTVAPDARPFANSRLVCAAIGFLPAWFVVHPTTTQAATKLVSGPRSILIEHPCWPKKTRAETGPSIATVGTWREVRARP